MRFYGTAILAGLAFGTLLILVVNARALPPVAQPDVDLTRSGSTYPITCQPTEPFDKMIQICAVRTDLDGDPVELGCVNHTTIEAASLEITVARTPFEDAEVRCYAIDSEGNISAYSDNVGIADFTPNGKPWVTVNP